MLKILVEEEDRKLPALRPLAKPETVSGAAALLADHGSMVILTLPLASSPLSATLAQQSKPKRE